MEHIMNFCTKRQLQSIGHIADALEHLEGSVILRPKLGVTSYVQGSCRTMQEAKPYPLTRLILHFAMLTIIHSLVMLLSLL
uniref:Uncharacterized protein n=1 Tax=Kalanchoe fedtschenkoi TaxID=63787 RepID=A0A7N1A6G8_KALFE